MAGPNPKYDCPWALSDQWYWILLDSSSISADQPCYQNERLPDPQTNLLWSISQRPPCTVVGNSSATKSNLKSCGILSAELETRASDRPSWRTTCREAIDAFESNRLDQLKEKRQRRKQQPTTNAAGFLCDICCRSCGSRIGLFAHRSHRWWDSSHRRLSPYCFHPY